MLIYDFGVFLYNHQVLSILLGLFLIGIFWIVITFGKTVISAYKAQLKVGLKNKVAGIILGGFLIWRVHSPEKDRYHIAVLGGTGSGKTVLLIETLRSLKKTNFFVIDISGDIVKNTPVKRKLIFNPLNPINEHPYNLFDEVDRMEDRISQDEELNNIALSLIPQSATQDNAKWFENAGRDILSACLITFYYEGLDFMDICNKLAREDYTSVFYQIDKVGNPEAVKYISQFANMEPKQIQNCYQTAQSAIMLFTSPRLKNAIRRPREGEVAITSSSIEENNVFFVLPDKELIQYSPLVALIVNQLFHYLSDRPVDYTKKLLVALDEYGSFKGVIDITPALEKIRKRNVRIMILLQSLAKLDYNYGKSARRNMMENINLNVVCGLNDLESEEYFVKKAGKVVTKSTTKSGYPHEVDIFKNTDFERLRFTQIIFANGYAFKLFKTYYYKNYRYYLEKFLDLFTEPDR